jgi:2-polyprenyl-6-hydroxyphenyl methylase/3-demethylubiquinone-9 3-methyltransferase
LEGEARTVVGIDTSGSSLILAREMLGRVVLAWMDAGRLGFVDGLFDVVVCIQNGISAFKVDYQGLMLEALRVTRPGGRVLFSSYAEDFWEPRLQWFEIQAAHGLIGEIDYDATGAGVIVGVDGFRATTVADDDFSALADELGFRATITTVDGSSVFCELMAE